MPRKTRDYLIRYYEHAINDLDRCLTNLKKMYDIYDPDYPDHAGFLEQFSAMVINLQELLTNFRQGKM